MAWDSTRPVPWNRLVREWLIYAAIMTAVFTLFFRGDNVVGAIAGVLLSGPLYLAFGAVMAKFGYSRTRMKNLRSERKQKRQDASESEAAETDFSDSTASRSRPAPTSRTSGGSNRPRSTSKRKR